MYRGLDPTLTAQFENERLNTAAKIMTVNLEVLNIFII